MSNLEIRKTFSLHLKTIRKERFKSVKSAARASKIKYGTYRNYEKGIALPTVDKLAKIKEGFNISFELLFKLFLKDIKIDKEFLEIESNLQTIRKSDEHWSTVKNMIQFCYQSIKDKENLSKKRDIKS